MIRMLVGGEGIWFQLGRLNTWKIIVIVLFQIRPGRKHLCLVRQTCKGQKVLSGTEVLGLLMSDTDHVRTQK